MAEKKPPKGPRTPQAKARVSVNAVRHGLRSTKVVIPGMELQADWERFFKDTVKSLSPVGAVEYALTERIATLFWRLRRAARAERDAAIAGGSAVESEHDAAARAVLRTIGSIGSQFYPDDARFDAALQDDPQSSRAPALLPVPLELQSLSRYEYRLSRQLLHALHELQALQDRREGRDAPLARVDVQGFGDA
jgi:hypothetical protein